MHSPSSPSPTEQPPVRVTLHAAKRGRERHADLRDLQERHLFRLMSREVGEALREGRVARNAPRDTCVDNYTYRTKADKWVRFAWNASCSRVYVFKRTRGVVLIVTVLATVNSQR